MFRACNWYSGPRGNSHIKNVGVDRIHPQSNKFTMSVENKATGDSKQ